MLFWYHATHYDLHDGRQNVTYVLGTMVRIPAHALICAFSGFLLPAPQRLDGDCDMADSSEVR